MADYTQDEITAAVSQLVQSTIATSNTSLGTRSTQVTFQGIQAAAAGIFILYPLAPFYCVYLGAQQLLESLASEVEVLENLVEAVGSLGRLVLPVTDLTPLYNAQAALQALSTAVTSGAPSDITKLPQYQRYTTNVSTFLSGPASAVKQNGAIVPTPQEAVASIPGLVSQLQTAHEATVQSAMYLQNAMTDFASVNLSSLVAQGIINNASSVLAADTATLAGLSASQRLAALRTPILNLITAQSTVTAFGSASPPSPFYSISGTGYPYADATHLATPAVLEATVGPPYAVVPQTNDQLTVTLDGGASTTVSLPSSLFAVLQGTIVEQAPGPDEGGTVDGYLIGNGAHPTGLPTGYVLPNNNLLHFKITSVGGPTYDVNVPLSVCADGPPITRRTAQQVSDDINAHLVSLGITQLIAEPYFYPAVHFQGAMNISLVVGPSAVFDIVAGSLAAVVLGDLLVITTGPNAGLWNVTGVNSSTEISATKQVGSATAQTGVQASIGPKDRAVRLRFTAVQAVNQQWTVLILGDSATATSTAQTLGFAPGYSVTCSPEIPTDIITYVNQQQTAFTMSSVVTSPFALSLTTDPINPFHVIASKYLASGVLTYTAGSPNTVALTGLVSDPTAVGVAVGDTLVLRGQNQTVWTVSAVTSTSVTATSSSSTGSSASSMTFEVGPSYNFAPWQTIQVTSGANQGNFLIASIGVSPIDLTLYQRTPIPHYTDPVTAQAIVQSAVVGTEMLTFSSKNQTTSSSVAVAGTAVPLFWSSAPLLARGTTGYFFLPTPSAGAAPVSDDVLEFFGTSYNTPDSQYTVTTVDAAAAGYILGVTPNVSDSPTTWTFGQIPPPFAQLRHGHVVDYLDFQTALTTWLALPTQQSTWFQSLNRVINPLIANTSPTASDIGAAQAMLTQLAIILDEADATANNQPTASTLEAILDAYTVDDVSQIDTLIKTYQAQGGDAAIDILTSAQFSTFFGLTQDQTSYAGAMQSAMRSVAQNDLPVRKTNRASSVQSPILGTSQSPDYEFDTSDSESGTTPDAPADFEKTTGSST